MILGSIIVLAAILAGLALLAGALCLLSDTEDDPDPQYSALDQKDGLR